MKILNSKTLLVCFGLFLAPLSIANCQSFTFQMVSDTVDYEFPGGSDIVLTGNMVNTGLTDLNIDIIRAENNLPLNWQSYLCTNVCENPPTDSILFFLGAGQSQLFHFSFIISTLPDTGDALVHFKNVTDTSNHFSQRFYGIATPFAGINDVTQGANVQLYPNPVNDKLWISTNNLLSKLEVYNMTGENIFSVNTPNSNNFSIDMSNFQTGTYFVRAIDINGKVINKKICKY